MTSENLPHRSFPPFPVRALLGTVAAAVLVYLFSALHADPSMRVLPIVVFVAAAGAVGGAAFPLTDPLCRRGAGSGVAANALGLLVYGVIIAVAFVVARHGPF